MLDITVSESITPYNQWQKLQTIYKRDITTKKNITERGFGVSGSSYIVSY